MENFLAVYCTQLRTEGEWGKILGQVFDWTPLSPAHLAAGTTWYDQPLPSECFVVDSDNPLPMQRPSYGS